MGDPYRTPFFVAAALLVASVGLLVSSRVPAGRPPQRAADEREAARSGAASATPEPEPEAPHTKRLEALETELDSCRAASWRVVVEAIRTDVRTHRAARDTAKRAAADSDYPQQRAALEEIALEHVRRHWNSERANLIRAIGEVGTEPWLARFTADAIEQHAARSKLDAPERTRLESAYGDLLARHMPAMREQIKAEDWASLIAAAKRFWADEDALVERLLGAAARAAYRSEELRARTAAIAIVATLAGGEWAEWGESLAW